MAPWPSILAATSGAVTVRLGGEDVSCVFRQRVAAKPGEIIRVAIDADNVHLFDTETGRRLVN